MAHAPSRSGSLAIAAAIVAFGFFGSRLLGVVRSIVIAGQFGSSADYEAYVVAFRIPDLIFQVLAGATLGAAFIPVFARIFRNDSEDAAWRLASNVINLVAVATAALCVLAFLLAPWLVPLTAPGLEEEGKAVDLTRFMLLSPMLFAVSGMCTGILNARQRFLLPALAPMVYNLAIIGGALFLAGPWGVWGLATGVVLGAALHLGIQLPGLARERMRFEWTLDWHDASVREVARLMGPRVVGLAAAQLNFVITVFFASKLTSGTIASLNYAWVLAGLPLALFGMALSTAAFPRLADNAADGDMDSLRETVSRVLRVILFLTIPAALGLALLAKPVTALLLQRGDFTAVDTLVTSQALAFYCLGIVPQAGIEIHSRGFYALSDTRTPVILAVIAMVTNLILSALLWEQYDVRGLAFSVSAASWLEWALLYYLYVRRLNARPTVELNAAARFTLCAALMVLFLAVALAPFDWNTRDQLAVIAVGGAIAGLLVYTALNYYLETPELRDALDRFRNRVGRAQPAAALPDVSAAEANPE